MKNEFAELISYENPEYPVKVTFLELNENEYRNTDAYEMSVDAIVVLIVNNGTLRVSSGSMIYTIETGKGIIINKNVSHKLWLASKESCGLYCVMFSEKLIFPEPSLYEKYAKIFVEDMTLPFIQLTEKSLRDETVIDGLNRIIAINLVKKKGYEIVTKAIMCNVWLLIQEYAELKNGDRDSAAQSSLDEKRVRIACNYIAEHYAEIVTLDDIAECINLSPGECCRCFKRVMMKSPIQYLLEFRTYSAARIIYKNPKEADSMADLSLMTGFNHPSYFNKVFRKNMQCTPSEFKKMIREDPDKAERIYIALQEEITFI